MAHESPVIAINPPFSVSIQRYCDGPQEWRSEFLTTLYRDGRFALQCVGSTGLRHLQGALMESESAIRISSVEAESFEWGRFCVKPLKILRRAEEGEKSFSYTAQLYWDELPVFEYTRSEALNLNELVGGGHNYVVARENGLSMEDALRELEFRRVPDQVWERER